MPLLDHLHPPIHPLRRWESFHAPWASAIVERLNRGASPRGDFPEAKIHVGCRVEVDAGAPERPGRPGKRPGGGTAAIEAPARVAAEPMIAVEATFPDSIEALIYGDDGARLVAAVEPVSPGSEDRGETRRALAATCSSDLRRGVGMVVVDDVTSRRVDLSDALMELLGGERSARAGEAEMRVASDRPVRSGAGDGIDIWAEPMAVGRASPKLPPAIGRVGPIPLDLEVSCGAARDRSRLDDDLEDPEDA